MHVVFTPCSLANVAAGNGFAVRIFEDRNHRLPSRALNKLRSILRENHVLYRHDYIANIVKNV